MTKVKALNIVKELIKKERQNANIEKQSEMDELTTIVEIAFRNISDKELQEILKYYE